MILPLVTTPSPNLIEPSTKVHKFDEKLHKLIADMHDTLAHTTDPKGVGLAAPQVGVNIRLFLAKPNDRVNTKVFINPEIVTSEDGESKRTKKSLLEGCLSIPNIWGKVKRKKLVKLTWQDQHGKSYTKVFNGFVATIIQHEVDHLDGILFTKHVLTQGQKLYKSYKNEHGEEEFEEIKV